MKNPRQRFWFWRLGFILLLAIGVYFGFKLTGHQALLQSHQPGLYRVVKFNDGDTIEVDMNGALETVRMIGVDSPETHHPERPLECYGREAAEYTKQLITGQLRRADEKSAVGVPTAASGKVRLQADPLNTNRDRYGRLLRYVYLPDNTMVQQRLLIEGYGFAYTYYPFEKASEFMAYEQQAKTASKGLWSACQVVTEANGLEHTEPVQ